VVLGALGALDLMAPSLSLDVFHLDGERTVSAAFSAALLFGAGVLAWWISLVDGERLGSPGVWRFMGAFLAFMALDELFAIHEHVSAAETGISWQVFYAPITVSAVVAWFVVLRRLPAGAARGMWIAGAGAWFVSQAIEAIQWEGNRLVHEWTFVPEETLEMAGSLLWGLALLVALGMLREADVDRGETEAAGEPVARDYRLGRERRRRVRGEKSRAAPVERTPSGR
jgi:hypothetical protein